ncbi:MAG TPA: peptidylprolyl isomerase [Gemmatimonadales bacterium]|nr:peptidylprolyl isomerase [Gemmatimonadales bacterium]
MTKLRVRSVVAVWAALLWGAALPLAGQGVTETSDRIIAVVGNKPILLSEVDEQVNAQMQRQNQPVPSDTALLNPLRRQMIQELIDLELLYQIALTDTTVRVTDEQVNAAVDEQVRNVRRKYQSDQQYRADLQKSGFFSPEEYRRWLTDTQRKELIRNALLDHLRGTGKLKAVIPTDRELRAAFEQQKGKQKRPETVSFKQIVITPKPSPEAKARALAHADSILAELRKGADFATAAKRFSMDPASKEQGGSLGWFRRGQMVTKFEDVAFLMKPGVISNPVETEYGYHLIQVERVQPAEVSARHILIIPELVKADLDTAEAIANRVKAQLEAGANIDSLIRVYSDPLEEKDVRDLPLDKLLPAYAEAFKDIPAGGYTPVFRLESPTDPMRSKFAVAMITDRQQAGEFKYEDVKDRLRGQLGDQMAIRRYLDRLRAASFVDVREL